ncbi:hypothetical protein [Acuticoccus yangtzensis]|uniref:hypothetical protein n=1 Tax=Acuticoccus yangtzensis TaxID=1443441 RepID=UPI0009497788|nr:hypothetical protein [Acuticoccus yangtzensis]
MSLGRALGRGAAGSGIAALTAWAVATVLMSTAAALSGTLWRGEPLLREWAASLVLFGVFGAIFGAAPGFVIGLPVWLLMDRRGLTRRGGAIAGAVVGFVIGAAFLGTLLAPLGLVAGAIGGAAAVHLVNLWVPARA